MTLPEALAVIRSRWGRITSDDNHGIPTETIAQLTELGLLRETPRSEYRGEPYGPRIWTFTRVGDTLARLLDKTRR